MKVINKEIKNDTYMKLIEYASQKCNMLLFGFYIYTNPYYDAFNKNNQNLQISISDKFSGLFLGKKEKYYWIAQVEYDYDTYYFNYNEELKDYLLSNCDLYGWNNPFYPTDLGFFINGKCWLMSVTHEKMCDICVENEKEFEYLKSIGIEFLETSFREATKKEIYVEKELENGL